MWHDRPMHVCVCVSARRSDRPHVSLQRARRLTNVELGEQGRRERYVQTPEREREREHTGHCARVRGVLAQWAACVCPSLAWDLPCMVGSPLGSDLEHSDTASPRRAPFLSALGRSRRRPSRPSRMVATWRPTSTRSEVEISASLEQALDDTGMPNISGEQKEERIHRRTNARRQAGREQGRHLIIFNELALDHIQ